MPDKRDYYEVLGISKSANETEIKKAYRKLAKQFHPDMNQGDKEAESKFKEVNEAYEVLSDPQKKSRYDQFGHAGMDGNNFSGFGGFGFDFGGVEDIFDSFFGGGFGKSSRSRRTGPKRGADLNYSLNISFEEAAFGINKDINIRKNQECNTCNGSGAKPGTSPETCKQCNGTGQIQYKQSTPFGQFVNVKTCDVCRGEGKIIVHPCTDCHGTGKVQKSVKISINVPAGIDDGQTISLRGEGEPGSKGGPAGDLYVTVRVQSHPLFQRQGYDIICDIPITFAQAALGCELEVPTLDGKVKYTVPEGTQSETVFRLRNRGVKHLRSNSRGDQYVKVQVEVPTKLTQSQKELLKQFAEIDDEECHSQRKSFFDKMKDLFQ